MLEALKRLISPEYLVVADPGPMGSLWVLYAVLGLLFLAGFGAAVWGLTRGVFRARPGRHLDRWAHLLAWIELWICLAGMGSVIGRFLGWPGWSARIWPYSLAGLAVLGAVVYRFRHLRLPGWLDGQIRTLSFSPLLPPAVGKGAGQHLPLWFVAGLGLHLVGTGFVVNGRYGWPIWTAPLVLGAVLLPQVPLMARRRLPHISALTPLLGAYAAAALWLLYHWLGITVIGWQGLAFPNPMVSLFYVDGIVLAAASYCLLCQIHVVLSELGRPLRLWRWAAAGLLTVTLVWAGIVYLGKRTHGATASDPYAYAQMGVDLATRGTFLHRFSLFEQVIPLNIAWAPLQPVGYHISRNSLGDCPSVWATGASVLLAAGYKLFGESGLYVTNPIVALLALGATWGLVQEVLRNSARPVRYLAGALAVTLLATSPEHVDRILVPMADAPAQLFTILTLLFALRAMRHRSHAARWEWAIAGACFGWAYWVRHTQLVLILPVALAMWFAARQEGKLEGIGARLFRLISPMAVFLAAALVAALPDIIYRWRTFGSPLATETTELHAMAIQNIGAMAWQTLRDTLVAGEWGYLFPLVLFGGYRLLRDHRREALVLFSAFAAILVVHLTYQFLRLRDLISVFPLVDLAAGYGAILVVDRVRRVAGPWTQTKTLGPALLSVGMIAWTILSLASARWTLIDNLWKPGWASFGYMRTENRAAFDRLAELTPPEAVIGASLNAGAVMLYSGRDAIRPYDSWNEDEWNTFLAEMQRLGRSVYLLDDGGLMAAFIDKERGQHSLEPVEALQVPLFDTKDGDTGWLYRLEWAP
jgi:hypothetical protein